MGMSFSLRGTAAVPIAMPSNKQGVIASYKYAVASARYASGAVYLF